MDSESKIVKVKPSIFAEATYLLDGQPFRLKNRNYLKEIYDGNIEEGMIMSGRQVEKSTTNSTKIANCTLLMPNFKGLYFAPLNSQVKEFSGERLGKLYEYSNQDVIQKCYKDKHDTDAVFMKTIKNTNATLYLKHCYGLGDNIRGITVNGIWGDEIQDVHIDALPVIKECQAHALEAGSRNRITWYTGTPKTFSNTIQQYWDKSSQNEWVVKCPHCNTYQILGVKNLTPKQIVCRKCKQELPKENIINGFWYELRPNISFKGFRISQVMVPWITAEDLWKKYTSYSTGKFFNEVLGRSYEDASKPFTALTLEAITDNSKSMYLRAVDEFANKPIFMGVDWGTGEKSYTIVTIAAHNDNGKFQILYVKRYDTGDDLDVNKQLDHISYLIIAFKVKLCVVDWGFGYTQYNTLQQRFGKQRVTACYYSFNQRKERKYDPDKGRWIVNRTMVMQAYINAIKDQMVVWPGKDRSKFPWLYDHHLVENAEYRKSQNGRSEDLFYTHPEGQPDDALHSGVYCFLASKIANVNNAPIVFASAYGNNI